MDPKSVTVISLLVGFATFLSINRVISNPNFNPVASLKLPDLKSIVLSQIPVAQNAGFSKLLSLNPGRAAVEESAEQTANGMKNIVETPASSVRHPELSVAKDLPARPPTGEEGQNDVRSKIVITENQINQNLNSYIPAGTPVQDLAIKLEEGKIKVSGKLLSPIQGNLTAQVSLAYVNKTLVVKIQNASVGAMSIPTFLLTSLEGAANQAINNLLQQESGTTSIKSIEVQQGKILINL